MTPDSFATGSLHPRDQLEAWVEWFGPVFDLIPKHPNDGGFPAEIRFWRLGGVAMTRSTAPPVYVARTKTHLKRDPVDHWVVRYCARGAHSTVTAGISLEVPARVPFLWSLGQEFVHDQTHVDRTQFIISRDAFPDLAPLLDDACGSTLDTPLGHLLGDYMTALERHLSAVTEADLPYLADAAGAMVAAAVAPSAVCVAVARPQIDLGRKERVRQAVRRHLRTPTLRPRTLCRLVGNVPIQPLSAVRSRGRCRQIQPGSAALGGACNPDRPKDQQIDFDPGRGILLCRLLKLQPRLQTRVRLQPRRGAVVGAAGSRQRCGKGARHRTDWVSAGC